MAPGLPLLPQHGEKSALKRTQRALVDPHVTYFQGVVTLTCYNPKPDMT